MDKGRSANYNILENLIHDQRGGGPLKKVWWFRKKQDRPRGFICFMCFLRPMCDDPKPTWKHSFVVAICRACAYIHYSLLVLLVLVVAALIAGSIPAYPWRIL